MSAPAARCSTSPTASTPRPRASDLVGTYAFHLGDVGRLDTTLAYNYNKTDVTKYNPTVISQARIIDIQHYAPNNRVNFTGAYTLGQVQGDLA